MVDPRDPNSPTEEHKYHRYIGTDIPWYVHLIWVCYWAGAIWYVLTYQLPWIRKDFLSAP